MGDRKDQFLWLKPFEISEELSSEKLKEKNCLEGTEEVFCN